MESRRHRDRRPNRVFPISIERSERLRIITEKLQKGITAVGLVRIGSVGKEVDPRLHHVEGVVRTAQSPGTIVRELQSGYEFRDSVLRAAVVIAAATPDEAVD